MTKDEMKLFSDLASKISDEKLLMPQMPGEIYYPLHKIASLPSVELLITTTGKNFLLTYRDDEYWKGWHIPGGFVGYMESIEDSCKRVAKKELGIEVQLEKIFDAVTWKNHPYGAPVSILCRCTPIGEPKVGKYFDEIPEDVVPNHGNFLKRFLAAS